MIRIQSFSGSSAQPYITDLARLRIEVFRDFPYLYNGTMAYEEEYLQTFFAAPDSVIIIAFAGDQVIGASTGVPMEYETENIQRPWLEEGYDIRKIFYYGESVLQKAYRGQGVGVQFFRQRETWARSLERFEMLTFCAVLRPEDHPLKPENYQPLDAFWRKRGFAKTENMVCHIAWQDIEETQETQKPLHFWSKAL